MPVDNYGDKLAQVVSDRIGQAVANEAALSSLPNRFKKDGRLFLAASEGTLWRCSGSGSAAVFYPVGSRGAVRYVRGVATANVADLTAFTVAGNDGITYVAGDRILLPIQTTAAQCGVYVVGTVAAGSAPLTRATDMPAGYVLPLGSIIEVGPEGTLYGGSTWKSFATTAGGAVIGTNDPVFYPRSVRATVTLVAGVKALGATEGLWLRSTTRSSVQATLNTPNTVTATIDYRAAVASRTAGKVGTAAVTVAATKSDGTTDTDNVSTVDVLIENW